MKELTLGDIPQTLYTKVGKRCFDVVGAIVLILVFFIPGLVIAFAIWLDDRGPAFFLQERMGINRSTFLMFKFRTMTIGGDEQVTRVGRFLRKYHLDEMLQLFNVLLGQMSISGPRAMIWELVHAYAEEGYYYDYGPDVKPGITGYLQCRGPKKGREGLWGGIHISQRIAEERVYLEHLCFSLDVRICGRTVPAMLGIEWDSPIIPAKKASRTFEEQGAD